MDIYAQIKNSLKEIAGQGKQVIHVAKVVEVEESEATCVCEIDGLQVSDVKLRSVLNEESEQLLIVPKRGSYVLVYDMSMGLMRDFVVVSYSEVSKIDIRIGETTIKIEDGEICINGGKNSGLVKIEKLTEKLNGLVNAFNAHTHSGVVTAVTGGVTTPVVGTTGITGGPGSKVNRFDKSEYEDTKITH